MYVHAWVEQMFFFFKQKTAYEMLRSLVGSEMCIRDRNGSFPAEHLAYEGSHVRAGTVQSPGRTAGTPPRLSLIHI